LKRAKLQSALVLACLAATAPGLAAAETVQGNVLAVHDGATMTIRKGGVRYHVRLAGVAAPALDQQGGVEAKDSLQQLCLRKLATVQVVAVDRWGWTHGQVSCEGTDAAAEQLRRGLARTLPGPVR
jgi:endonuclease YncB( thermonuclease family)